MIAAADLAGLPAARRATVAALLARQPRTALAALAIPGVGRATCAALVRAGRLADPDGVLRRPRTAAEMAAALAPK